ncbi:M20/M25/M40 family metallo-hydrolase [Pontibacter fetidus]|uniref:M20/M25/M40 family metallo-hydrolase n=1 Tax=Pontibacter fetidus TaxID=2700082 RepID=A0A6B2GVJ9_9BACT|nr:M20/M25/M40 family metallo-hydrolase [Pontibacter fetidus]NDK54835.1 M20/M25/M40 family metallo-hydrolase [Pontibacter fetidus]
MTLKLNLTRLLALLTIASLYFTTIPATSAQTIVRQDDEIKKMVDEISAANLEALVRKLASFETRHSLSTIKDKKKGVGTAREWVKSEFEKYAKASGDRMTVELDKYQVKANGQRIPEDVELANVMATLKGTDPNDDRVLIISGHMDSRNTDVMDAKGKAPGANDDGSGVAAVMELARIMASRQFPATIVFVAVTGEEQGLLGARHLAEKAKAQNWNLIAMLNNDMIGNSFSNETELRNNMQVRIFSEGIPAVETEEQARMRRSTNRENDSESRQLARYMKETGERYVDQLEVKLVYRNDRFLRGGDHTPFSQNGFAAIRVCEMNENYNHQHQDVRVENGVQYGDLPEFIDYEYMRKNAALNLASLANLAWAPYAPTNVGVNIKNLTNKTDLQWEAPAKGKKPAGYYVLMRETSSPVWEKKFFVKDTKVALPYSKDNYFFAVQSVDAEGHESLAVFPVPVR